LGDAVDLFVFKFADGIHDVMSVIAFQIVKENRDSLTQSIIQVTGTMSCTSKFSRHVTVITNSIAPQFYTTAP
jgi:hypothetical protein